MNIRENIQANKYEPTIEYPNFRDISERAEFQRRQYNEQETKLVALFMDDLRHHVEMLGVPHQYSTKLCSKAWEDRAYGFGEVVTCAENIAEIFN